MFADVSNASKVAFVWAVHQMVQWGIKLIDCQIHTEHLERFGAREISETTLYASVADYILKNK